MVGWHGHVLMPVSSDCPQTHGHEYMPMPPSSMNSIEWRLSVNDSTPVVKVNSAKIAIDQVLAVARGGSRITLDDSAAFRKKLDASVKLLDRLIAGGIVNYGVTTGFCYSCESSVMVHFNAYLAANLI